MGYTGCISHDSPTPLASTTLPLSGLKSSRMLTPFWRFGVWVPKKMLRGKITLGVLATKGFASATDYDNYRGFQRTFLCKVLSCDTHRSTRSLAIRGSRAAGLQ